MINQDVLTHKLDLWGQLVQACRLPEWNAIPDIGLYMDQLVVLLRQNLFFIPASDERFVTPSTINNYVRLKVMPAPIQRRYHRVHIVYLIIILTLKQSLSISDIQRLFPADLPEEKLQTTYRHFGDAFVNLSAELYKQVQNMSKIAHERVSSPEKLVAECALLSGFSHIMAEAILGLQDMDMESALQQERNDSEFQHKLQQFN